MTMRSSPAFRTLLAALAVFVALRPSSVEAGCGCDKPPPATASVRPNVTYASMPVALFSTYFAVGATYTVTFTSGISGASASVTSTVVSLRDMADAVYKPQLVVVLPALPLGPTRITATRQGATLPDLSIADTSFTVAPDPIAVPYAYGAWQYPNMQAAVDRTGVLYISLDLSGVTNPLVYDAQLVGYPWRFNKNDAIYYNSQGFLMQKMVDSNLVPIPGMFVTNSKTPTTDSDILRYSRHEFSTYFLQHMERQPHSLDPTDANWHIDGTRHVDHNHIILAIGGKLQNGTKPPPGATSTFNLKVKAYSLFYTGLTGTSSITMSGGAMTDSRNSTTGLLGSRGDVYTQGTLTLKDTSQVNGNATAKTFSVATTAKITGIKSITPLGTTFMSIILPTGIPSLGAIAISTATTQTIAGPGSFLVSSISLSNTGARLFIDNTAGPVTLYVTGLVTVSAGTIQAADPTPEKFAIYVASTKTVTLSTTGSFDGVVYAPDSTLAISKSGSFSGAFFGKYLTMGTSARVHYDSSLSGDF